MNKTKNRGMKFYMKWSAVITINWMVLNFVVAQTPLLLPIYEGEDTIVFYNENFEQLFQMEGQRLISFPYWHQLKSPIICRDNTDEQHLIAYDAKGNILFERDSVVQVDWLGFQDGICKMVLGTPYDNHADWVDENGKELSRFNGKNVVTKFSEGLALYTYGNSTGDYLKCGVINKKGKAKSACKFYLKNNRDDHHYFYRDTYFSEGLCAIKDYNNLEKGEKVALYGYINAAGNYKVKPQFKQAKPFSEGLAAVQDAKTELWGAIDKSGEYVIEPQFTRLSSFKNGVASVRISTFEADLINQEGELMNFNRPVIIYDFGLMLLQFFWHCNPPSILVDSTGNTIHKSPVGYHARPLSNTILVEMNYEKGYPYIRYINLQTGEILESNYAKDKRPALRRGPFLNDF